MTPALPGHEVLGTLGRRSGQRLVLHTRVRGEECVTRVLVAATVARHYDHTVRNAVLSPYVSLMGLPEEIAFTLEGYRVASMLPGAPSVDVVACEPAGPARAEAWRARDVPFGRWAWRARDNDAGWTWRTRAVEGGVTAEGHVYVTTRYIAGTPLDTLLADEGERMQAEVRAALLHDVARILAELHAQEVAYGDLKVGNLVVTPDLRVALIDLDTLRGVGNAHTPAPILYATPEWAAPEQVQRRETLLASDVWAYARVVEKVWPVGRPPALDTVVFACRERDPLRRPNTRALLARVAGLRAGEPARPPLDDWRGAPIDDDAYAAPTPVTVLAVEDHAPAEPTIPLPDGTVPVETRPIGDRGAPPPSPSPSPPPAPDDEATELPRTDPALRDRVYATLDVTARVGVVVFVVFVMVVAGLLTLLYERNRARLADEAASAVEWDLHVHKTDPSRNSLGEAQRIRAAADAAWDTGHTPRTCAARAIAQVWGADWLRRSKWDPAGWAALRPIVDETRCSGTAYGMLARGTLSTAACVRADPEVPRGADCARALGELGGAAAALSDEAADHWLRVEIAWQETQVRKALVRHYQSNGDRNAAAVLHDATARCDEAEAWVEYAPVNGPELFESCLGVAALGRDLEHYFAWGDAMLRAPLPSTTERRRARLAHLYRDFDPACEKTKLSWKRNDWEVNGPSWCVAIGHLARGCVGAALPLLDAPTDDTVDLAPLRARAAAVASSATCVE